MLHQLSCCNNTKHICQECLDSLRRKNCPYCRNALDSSLFTEVLVSQSAPELQPSWGEYFESETNGEYNDISPYEYSYSRILRRQINRIRRRYLTETNHRNIHSNNLSRMDRRNERKNNDDYYVIMLVKLKIIIKTNFSILNYNKKIEVNFIIINNVNNANANQNYTNSSTIVIYVLFVCLYNE